jgi:kynurenine 3-monooxygenase
MQTKENVIILGAGLCGAALAAFLSKRGLKVTVYEKRPDLRNTVLDAGRSINLALSNRGIKALGKLGLAEQIRKISTPMPGRIVHDTEGKTNFQPYGKEGQFINSISRPGLNALLLDAAEKAGATIHFNHACKDVDLETGEVWLDKQQLGNWIKDQADIVFGTDGAYSVLRSKMVRSDRFNYQQHFIEHGYKELSIPPDEKGTFRMDPNGLHIWPRGGYMMIALPNLDGSFTVTLFLPFEGPNSFDHLKYPKNLDPFFKSNFPDAWPLLIDLKSQYRANPTSSLITIRCYPWAKGKAMLLGDAAHAIVPFYGQGMNAALEDCDLLDESMEQFDGNWEHFCANFQQKRKPDADAIADLALYNFIEMRDKVADEAFLLRKKIEARLHTAYPNEWIPQYTMVTFSHLPYAEAKRRGEHQSQIMQHYMALHPEITRSEDANLEEIISSLRG